MKADRMENAEGEAPVVINFFQGRAKALWLTALVLSFAVAVACIALACALLPRGQDAHDFTLNIVSGIFGIVGAGIFLICIMTAKMRTSKWIADENGVSYFCLGQKRLALGWGEMREAGFLELVSPRTHASVYYLYFADAARRETLHNRLKNGVTEGKASCLGKYNAQKAGLILYPVDPYSPSKDPLVMAARQRFPNRLKNMSLLQRAEGSAQF